MICFGQGGTEAEIIDDMAYGLPPLNMHLAREIMAQTRIYQRLRYSLLRRADLNALALTLIKVSQMVIDLGELVELDINPLRLNARGVMALDARVQLAPKRRPTVWRFAPIRKSLRKRSRRTTKRSCCCARCCRRTNRRCKRWYRAPRPKTCACAFSSRSASCRTRWRRR